MFDGPTNTIPLASMAKRKSRSKDDTDKYPRIPRSELEGIVYELRLRDHIAKHNGQFLKADDGSLHLMLNKIRVPLSRDRDNYRLAELMLCACGVSSLSQGAQAAIQRLQVLALRTASNVVLRHFAALSADYSRLYIPVQGDKLMKVAVNSVEPANNGDNEDKLWVEHPNSHRGVSAFEYRSDPPAGGLEKFESLIVDTQACRLPAMRWLVAMHEGAFPFVRDYCRARFLVVHIGGAQQGKTTGAQRFTQLLGLGEVKGDYSVAALANQPDVGLLVMDNREQANFTQPLIDYCLFLSTGAQRGRSTIDGKERAQAATRPVGVITSIEGAWKPELLARCVEISYHISGSRIDRDNVEDDILKHRGEILSAMILVFQEWLRSRGTQQFWSECPRPGFERHFVTLAELLCAYAKIARKPERWAESIIADWERQLGQTSSAATEDDLEFQIRSVLEAAYSGINSHKISFESKTGTLYVTEAASLLEILRQSHRDELPKNATGFGRRLRSAQFQVLRFLDQDLAPQIAQLKRTAQKRPIGFFVADDSDNSDTGVTQASDTCVIP